MPLVQHPVSHINKDGPRRLYMAIEHDVVWMKICARLDPVVQDAEFSASSACNKERPGVCIVDAWRERVYTSLPLQPHPECRVVVVIYLYLQPSPCALGTNILVLYCESFHWPLLNHGRAMSGDRSSDSRQKRKNRWCGVEGSSPRPSFFSLWPR